MLSSKELEQVNPLAIQKRIITPFSLTEIEDYLGNLILSPHSLPSTIQAKTLLLAIIKEVLILRVTTASEETFVIPEEIHRLNIEDREKIATVLDSVVFENLTHIVAPGSQKILASCLHINTIAKKLQGICICDFHLDEKQTIHLREQEVIHIPTNTETGMTIELYLTHGDTKAPLATKLSIPPSSFGLLIDTREKDVLVHLPLNVARQLITKWQESLDIGAL